MQDVNNKRNCVYVLEKGNMGSLCMLHTIFQQAQNSTSVKI
jgi:hypothetical protein